MSEKQSYRDADDMPTERAVLEREWKAMRLALSTPRAALAAQPGAVGEPVRWEFRWLNPANDEGAREKEIQWELVSPKLWNQTMAERIAELEAYRYDGKPCYEVRALGVLAAAPTESKPAQQDAVDADDPLTDDEFLSMIDSEGLVIDPSLALPIKAIVDRAAISAKKVG